jgi:hypothetical protein
MKFTRKGILFYTFVFMFVVTFAVTIMGITDVIKIRDGYLNVLFTGLVMEMVAAVIGLFKGTSFFDDEDDKESGRSSLVAHPQLAIRAQMFTERLAGKWNWQGEHLQVEFIPDGNLVASNGEAALWEWTDSNYRQIEVMWMSGKYVDRLTISDDFLHLSGKNQKEESVRADRKNGPTRR